MHRITVKNVISEYAICFPMVPPLISQMSCYPIRGALYKAHIYKQFVSMSTRRMSSETLLQIVLANCNMILHLFEEM